MIGVLKEPDGENRVAILPEIAAQLVKMNFKVLIESTAGSKAFASDEDYKAQGAEIGDKANVLSSSDIILRINSLTKDEITKLKNGCVAIAIFHPFFSADTVQLLLEQKVTAFSLETIPRTTRAQSMDILSSQATASGYKAVLLAAVNLPKFFPMFMTAAGSITPAKVLILGAGVAGLQAIATARKLGSVVEAFDTRSAVKEEVNSLGAKFVEVEGAKDDKAAGGYAVEQSEEFKEKQKQVIHDHAVKSDVIITTAQIPGRKAPVLITGKTVKEMKKGSVIIDLAASTGGNCELTKNDETIEVNGVKIIGSSFLPSTIPSDSSKMFGKNVFTFLKLILKDGNINLNFDDDLVKGTCITHNGEIVNEKLRASAPVKKEDTK
ncbi:MAG: Re/Si-specific NAD(P)(+) transhydrogenase subunit alpha [Ignavibacteria bacterium]|nr:Re/Si-specific NAD(P)(+) transhydrogenase subunit alpha [Ignavibacteria bacterium]